MKIYSAFAIPLLIIFSILGVNQIWEQYVEKDLPISVSKGSAENSDTIVIVGVGDIMMGTIVPDRSFLPANNDCSVLFVPTLDFLKTADVTFGNLEGVFTNTSADAKKCKDPKTCYTFGMPEAYVDCLVNAGFDFISTANNHCGDFGQRGRDNTMRVLKEAGLQYAGDLSKPYAFFQKDGVLYGFCAFSPERGNCSFNDHETARKMITYLNDTCDIVIVSFHSGAEGPNCQHVPRKDEMFMGYNRGNVYAFSHMAIDAGADVVFGHGPHVSRAVELYKDRFIAYSLGNFLTYSRINVNGVNGLAPIVRLEVDKQGRFLKGKIIPTYQEKYKPPKVDPQKRVIKVIRELTKTDFPESPLIIDEEGNMYLPE